MFKRKFKTFETIAKLRKLYEADDVNQLNINEEQGGAANISEAEADATNPPANNGEDLASDPSKQANPEAGTFMSDNQKAEIAKMVLDALMMTPPEPGTIPHNLMNVTTDNADEVIKYIQSLNALNAPLSLDNETDMNSMSGALKDI